jgi:orotidine-5'-phosphate decarboxylase
MTSNPVFCALDTIDVGQAAALAKQLKPAIGGIKLGLEFFTANGPQGVREMAKLGLPIFLDLKLHDIPNTVAGAIRGLMPLAPALTTLHASGDVEMMRAAATEAGRASAEAGVARPRLVAVTLLTSLGEETLRRFGWSGTPVEIVKRLAASAQEAGMDGVVCSPKEVAALRAQCGRNFLLVVPGIRPAWSAANDQKRVMSPAEALQAGADILVIGRPITAAADPLDAAKRINSEIAA